MTDCPYLDNWKAEALAGRTLKAQRIADKLCDMLSIRDIEIKARIYETTLGEL